MATFPCTAISGLVRLGRQETAFRLAPAAPLVRRGRGVTTGKEDLPFLSPRRGGKRTGRDEPVKRHSQMIIPPRHGRLRAEALSALLGLKIRG